MKPTKDFLDILKMLEKHDVRYLIIGGYAFAFHAYPRFTKDIDILVDPRTDNITRVNRALAEFGSPGVFEDDSETVILQIGVPPNRIDILQTVDNVDFDEAWNKRVRGKYGDLEANWIGMDDLIASKSGTGKPRHDADVEVLRKIKQKQCK